MLRDVELSALRNVVKSLAESTDLLVEVGQVRAILRRRNSPYASHRTIEYTYIHSDGTAVVANHRHILAFSPAGGLIDTSRLRLEVEAGGERWGWSDEREAAWHDAEIPAMLIEPVLAVLRLYGLVGQTSALVRAAWPVPVLERWDDEGRPVYRLRRHAEVGVS